LQATDAELVEAARRGDLPSFGRLYERHYRMAIGIARSRLMDLHLAEDAAQEAFAYACRMLPTLQNGSRFPQWLGTICRRTASRLAMGRPNHEPLSENHEQTIDSSLAIVQQDVQDALTQLEETAREIVLLHYFSGLSHKEISEVVDLTPQAVHGRLQRARTRLTELLAQAKTKDER
jgi:RNA polymerase sigma-70 factor (ECF subfamily)